MNTKEKTMFQENNSMIQHGNSNLAASNVEACRICLATDVKMHNLRDTYLTACMENILKFNNSFEGLPDYICYECAPCLIKFNRLIEKSKTTNNILQDMFAKDGKITKTLIKEQNRSHLNIQSSFDGYLLINCYHIKYDEDKNSSDFIETEFIPNEKITDRLKLKNDNEKPSNEEIELPEKNVNGELEGEKELNGQSDNDVEEIKVDIPVIEIMSDDEQNQGSMKLIPPKVDEKLDKCSGGKLLSENFETITKKEREALKRKMKKEGEAPGAAKKVALNVAESAKPPDYAEVEDNFNIVHIPVYEQIEEWRKSTAKIVPTETGYDIRCHICHKPFSNRKALYLHLGLHNTKVHGNVRCGVCLCCFSTIDAMKVHSNRMHSNKYYCKFCPNYFNNIEDAKEHKIFGCKTSRYRNYRNNNNNRAPPRFRNNGNGFTLPHPHVQNAPPRPLLSIPMFGPPMMWSDWQPFNQ